MARGKKTGGRDFKPGKSGNPRGPAVLPEDVRAARALNTAEFTRLATRYLSMNRQEISAAVNNPATPALELIVASVIHKAVSGGDHARLGFLLDRLLGKVADRADITIENPIERMTDSEKLEAFRSAVKFLEGDAGKDSR